MTTTHPTTYPAYTAYAAHRDLATATAKAAGGAQALIRTLEGLRDHALAEGRYGEDTHRAALQALALVRVCEEILDVQARTSLTTAMEMRDAADTSGRHRQ